MIHLLFKKGIDVLSSKQTNILSAAFFIITTTVLTQILGLLKRRLLLSIFPANEVGIFQSSFSIPEFLFQILIGGTLFSSFIPIFSEYLSQGKKEDAFKFASSLATIIMSIFLVLSLFVILFSYQLSSLITPGFSHEQLLLMSSLIRIIQFTQVFFVVGVIFTAILQSFQHFLIPGIASSLYNVGIIVGILTLSPFLGIYGAAIGILLGAILFCAVQLPLVLKTHFKFSFILHARDDVLRFFHLMVPTSFMVITYQVSGLANVFFASFVPPQGTSYAIFEFTQTLALAPVLLFGQSIAQASFPALSQKREDIKSFLSILVISFDQIIYLIMPISAILTVLRIPVVRFFYGASRVSWQTTVEMGYTLSFFAIALFAQAAIYLFARAFYAYKDTKTPFFVALCSVLLNITLSYILIFIYKTPIRFLALSYSCSTILNASLLLLLLDRKIGLPKFDILWSFVKIAIATITMGVALYVPIKLLDQLVFDTTRTINLIILTGIASALGLASYVFFTWLLDIREAYYIIGVVRKFGDWRNIMRQIEELINGSKLNP